MPVPSEKFLQRRRPVWEALSDLFLDTELQDSHFAHIASVLAESGFTDEEVHTILFHEVYPACICNLHDPAGLWDGFNVEWLQEQILPNPSASQTHASFPPSDYWMFEKEWGKVLELLPEARRKLKAAN